MATSSMGLKLFLCGDVMTGRGVDQVLPHSCDPGLHEAFVRDARRYVSLAEQKNGPIPKPVDFSYVWGAALDVWEAEAPDLRIVNLETSVTTSDRFWPAKGIHYRMHPNNVPCLTAAGIDCCVLANNHVMDWGRPGLTETLSSLHDAGIATAGAGEDAELAAAPARIAMPGQRRVLVFASADVSSGVPAQWRAVAERSGVHLLDDLSERTADDVAHKIAADRRVGDVVVASIHWGGNWGYRVPSEQQRFARQLVERGVDIVHGHSSHHAKPIEFYNAKPIIYGCGDFVTDYEGIGGRERYRPWLSPMYFVTVADSGRIERLDIIPLRLRRFQLVRATHEDRQWLGATLNAVSADYGTVFDVTEDRLLASPAQR